MIIKDASKKLHLLQKYIDKQADDVFLWCLSDRIEANYLKAELRRIAWLIEDGNCEEIQNEIDCYDSRL